MFTNVSLFVSFNNGPSVHFQTQTIYVRTISIKRKINVYRVSKCSKSTAKHLRRDSAMVNPFLVSFHHLNLSHSVSFHSVWLMFPLSSPLPLTPAPPLPSCFAARSADQFQSGSMGDPHFGYLVLLTSHLPPPPHLPSTRPLSIWLAEWPELVVTLINTSVCWYHHDKGHGMVTVCAFVCVTKQQGGDSVWLCVSVCFWMTVPSPLRPKCTLHVITGGVCVDAFMWHA